jgi:hypothetical protein
MTRTGASTVPFAGLSLKENGNRLRVLFSFAFQPVRFNAAFFQSDSLTRRNFTMNGRLKPSKIISAAALI